MRISQEETKIATERNECGVGYLRQKVGLSPPIQLYPI